jgi:transcriptional regulator with XRE-family HTH domain/tetratricopeptide (TPR) repeat protein
MTRSANGRSAGDSAEADALGQAVRACRLRAGLSQEELAHRTQLSVRTIANIEAARVSRPHGHSLKKLADALGLTGGERESLLGWPRRAFEAGHAEDPSATDARRDTTARWWTTPPPRQLPADIGDFTGRADEIRQISAYLRRRQPERPPVTVISGQGGIGKSALGVRVAHAVADAFPDGQLFADLGGPATPQDPAVVLGWFLHAFGVDPAGMPADVAERTALFRSIVADRRVLIVLDDAAAAEQVRPLLPGTGASAAIITSRVRLDSLESARTFDLALFSLEESLALLTQVLTAGRVEPERVAAGEIVQSCGYLPLAVRIAAARLAARPDLSMAAYAWQLANEQRRLDQLRLGDLEVRASIELSYVTLDAVDKVAFSRLGIVDLPSLSAWVLGPLLDTDVSDTDATADRLAERRLLDIVGADPSGRSRYRVHDLVRLFALGRLRDDCDEPARLAALERALGMWLTVAETVTDALPTTSDLPTRGAGPRWSAPPWFLDDLRRKPRDWFRTERTNLAAAVQAAAANGLYRQAWEIAGSMASPCLLYGDYDILASTLDVARGACQQGDDAVGEATMLAAAGRLRQELCDLDGAHQLFQEAFHRFRNADDARGQAFAAIFTADTLRALAQRGNGSDLAEASRWGVVARDLCEKLDDTARMVDAWYVLGKIFLAQDRTADAGECFRTVLTLGGMLGKPTVRAHALFQLGRIARTSRHLSEATPAYREALDIAEGVGDLRSAAFIAYELATAEAEQGEVVVAMGHAEQAMHVYGFLRVEERMRQAKTLVDELTVARA